MKLSRRKFLAGALTAVSALPATALALEGSRPRYVILVDWDGFDPAYLGRAPGSQLSSVWHIPPLRRWEKLPGYHPAQEPSRLVRRPLLASTQGGELVFDPVCDPGRSAAASRRLGWPPGSLLRQIPGLRTDAL